MHSQIIIDIPYSPLLFILLGSEVLDSLKVYQRISTSIMPIVITLRNLLTELLPPQRNKNRPEDVRVHKEEYRYRKGEVVKVCGKNDGHHETLRNGWDQPEE